MDSSLNDETQIIRIPPSKKGMLFQESSTKDLPVILLNQDHQYLPTSSKNRFSPSTSRMWVLGVILLGLVFLKCLFNPYPVGEHGLDGTFYYQIARHVSEGDGLLTSVSLYHQGLKDLPKPSTIYPLWPLILGGVGALLGLDWAASVLPEIFYIISLVLLYWLSIGVAKIWGKDNLLVFPSLKWLDIGHLFIILMGLNPVFFRFTSLPYTEALAFSLAFGALLALQKTADGSAMVWAAVSSTLAGLAYLTRSQMLGVVVAIPISLFFLGLKTPLFRRAAAISVVAVMAVILPWIAYLWTVATPLNIRMLIDFAAYQETPELQALHYLVNIDSLWDVLIDRATGFLVAFDIGNRYSYFYSFGPSAYIPLVALVYLFVHPKDLHQGFCSIRTAQYLGVLSILLAALACLGPVHLFHADYLLEWLFPHRHGLPFLFLIVLSFAYLLSRKQSFVRGVVLCLLFLSFSTNANAVYRDIQGQNRLHSLTRNQTELAAWIKKQVPVPVFATTKPWVLGATTQGVFHWVQCQESAIQMMTYFELVGVDHVITKGKDIKCNFFQSIRTRLSRVQSFQDESEELIIWRVLNKNRDVE